MKRNMVGVMAVSIAALLFAGCGGSESAAPVESSSSTTTIAALSSAQIEALLPSNAELPAGWSTKVAMEEVDDLSKAIPDVGLCFGQKATDYANAQNVIRYTSTDYLIEGSKIQSKIVVYGFPSANAANSFMALSIPSCPSNFTILPQYQSMSQKVSKPVAGISGADDSYMVFEEFVYYADVPSVSRSVIFSRSRVGDVVFEISMAGFTLVWNDTTYKPNYETTKTVSEQIVRAVRERMGVRPSLPTSTTTIFR
jgi:hypothetical protein